MQQIVDTERWVHAVLSKSLNGLDVTIEEYPDLKLVGKAREVVYNLLTKAYYLMDHVDDSVQESGYALVRMRLKASALHAFK